VIDFRPIKLAVVAEDSLQQHRLKSALEDFGCEVISFSPQSLELKGIDDDVSAWLLDLREDDALLDTFLELEQPILLGFESAPSKQDSRYPKWEKNLYAKLKQLLGKELLQTQASLNSLEAHRPVVTSTVLTLPKNIVRAEVGEQAKYIWVLGSSLGGPEAVKEFLDALPKGLPVGFIYGQHIDAQFVPVLAQVLARHAHFTSAVAQGGDQIRAGEVLIVPADREATFINGVLQLLPTPWPGPYGPSIDQLILNTHHAFSNIGVMIFSGMGNDGAEAIQQLEGEDLTVWAQSSETCASSAMPDACRETGAVKFSGTPQEMAGQLVAKILLLEASAAKAEHIQ
jgi:chemosensory pili system protein ChpB (putative protein-glutamate methylesterase)